MTAVAEKPQTELVTVPAKETALAVFRADNGDEYRHVVELETEQAQLLGELTDTWRDMLREARDGGNPRHHSHDVVRAWPLVTQHARGES